MEFSRRNLEAAIVSLTSTPGILKIQLLRSRVVTLRFQIEIFEIVSSAELILNSGAKILILVLIFRVPVPKS